MLRDGRMAGLVKLHRGDRPGTERRLWADPIPAEYLCGNTQENAQRWSVDFHDGPRRTRLRQAPRFRNGGHSCYNGSQRAQS